jgi:hypothetical protein
MKIFKSFFFCIITFSLSSCMTYYDAYLRNATNQHAIVDVYLLNKSHLKTLPNQVTVADRIVNFKAGYRKYFGSLKNVEWITTGHFKFIIDPNTTADLTDMVGRFINSQPFQDALVTVSVNNKIDTLLNGRQDFRHDLFKYKSKIFGKPILYYDIK